MAQKNVAKFTVPYIQVLDEKGNVDSELEPKIEDEKLLELYRLMFFSREADARMLNLQRQGRLGTFAPATGQEACACGAAFALGEKDWIAGTYRELGARLHRGESLKQILLYYNGFEEGSDTPVSSRLLPTQIILGSQALHAVGLAYAMDYLGENNSAALTFFGDGASSQGDVHEAMNFAGVWKSPVVFFCQNNGYAISVPRKIQSASETLAQRAFGYNMDGIQVDGNDVLAVYKATKEAIEKAHAGGGPTFIEAITYRLLMHTTADDPKKYRDKEEEDEWWKKEPLIRFKKYLEGKGILTAELHERMAKEIKEQIEKEVQAFEAHKELKPDAPFDHVFANSHESLEKQRQEFLENIGKD